MSSEMPAGGRVIEVGGARLYVEASGDAPTPVLLCLHGLGGGTHFFGGLGAALAAHGRTVAIDLPGSGVSPRLGPPAVTSWFDTVADLVVDLVRGGHAGGPRVVLLGHSMGTILALEVMRRSPDLAAGLIVVGGLPEPLPGARTRIRGRVETIRQQGITGMGHDVVAANFSRRSQAERPELTACFAKLFERQDPVAYAETAEALAAWTAPALPPLDDVPCLVIGGEEDRYAPPEAIQAFARTLPAHTRVEILRDCGHLPSLEQPAAFATLVAAFLRQIRA